MLTVQRDTRWQSGVSQETEDGASLRGSGERIVLTVADNGRPLRTAADPEVGLHLAGGAETLTELAERPALEAPQIEAAAAVEPALQLEVPPFPEVFRTYSAFVWRVLLRLGVAEADVDDVAQEVFLGIHRNLSRFEGRCTLRTWVYGICHRRAVDYRRRASVRPELYSDEPPEQSVAAEQEQGFALSQARQQLARVLDALDEEKRTVFVLFDIEGVPMDEVAEIVGCPLQTAYSRLYAARRKVESTLARQRSDRRSV